MIENHSIRRRARALLTFLNSFSSGIDDAEKKSETIDFNKAFYNLARIPEIPQHMKDELAANPNSLWGMMGELKEILWMILFPPNSQSQKGKGFSGNGNSGPGKNGNNNSSPSNQNQGDMDPESLHQREYDSLQDSVLDQMDDSVPEEYKNRLPGNLQKRLENILDGLGEDSLDYVNENPKMAEELQKRIVDYLYRTRNFSSDEKTDKDFGRQFGKDLDQQRQIDEILKGFAVTTSLSREDTAFKDVGYKVMLEFAENLYRSKDLQYLAEMIGRHKKTKEIDKTTSSDASGQLQMEKAYRGIVVGFEYSNDISRVLPSEISLLKNPATENLFYHKFAERQLLSYSYEQKSNLNKNSHRQKKGPIILCIDTSGSMTVENREDVAKSIAFAIARIAREEKRNLVILSFSVSVEVLNIGNLSDPGSVGRLVKFLSKSFYGGSEIEPCLEKAMDMLRERKYQKADIMLISDFELFDLVERTKERMKIEKSKGTRFHGVFYNNLYMNESVLNEFDTQWKYEGVGKDDEIHIAMKKSLL